MKGRNPLTSVPEEIQDLIISNLEPFAAINLKQVNRHFNRVVSLHRLDQRKLQSYLYRLDEGDVRVYLRRMETIGGYVPGQGWACFTCLRLKRKTDFTNTHTEGNLARDGARWYTRRCRSCDIAVIHQLCGQIVMIDDRDMVVDNDYGKTRFVCYNSDCATLVVERCEKCLRCRDCAEASYTPCVNHRYTECPRRLDRASLKHQNMLSSFLRSL